MSLWEVEEAARNAVPHTNGWARWHCPLCEQRTGKVDSKKSFSVSLETGYWTCFKCEEKGWLDELPKRETPARRIRPPAQSDLNIPEDTIFIASRDGRTAMSLEQARNYILVQRNVDWETIIDNQIGACVGGYYSNRLIFPVRRRGSIRGFIARSWTRSERAYLYPRGFDRGVFYNGDALDEETDQPLFVVEGVFDALRVGRDAVACLGKPTTAQVEQLMLIKKRPVVVALDADAWRLGASVAMTLRLHGVQAFDLKLPPGKDPDSLSRDWFLEKARDRLTDL